MYLVDGNRLVKAGRTLPAPHPFVVVPGVVEPRDDGGQPFDGTAGRRLHGEGVGIRLVGLIEAVPDAILVGVARARSRYVTGPQAAAVALQRVGLRIPVVERSEHRDAIGMRRPDAEPGAFVVGMGAQLSVTVVERTAFPAPDVFFREPAHQENFAGLCFGLCEMRRILGRLMKIGPKIQRSGRKRIPVSSEFGQKVTGRLRLKYGHSRPTDVSMKRRVAGRRRQAVTYVVVKMKPRRQHARFGVSFVVSRDVQGVL